MLTHRYRASQPLEHTHVQSLHAQAQARLATRHTCTAHSRLAAAAVAVPNAAAAAATTAAAAPRRLGHCCCRCHCRCPPAAAGGRLKQGSASRLYLGDATPAQGRFGQNRRGSRRGARRRAAWAAGTRWRVRSAHALTISSRAGPARQLLRPHVRTQRSAPTQGVRRRLLAHLRSGA